MTSYNRPPQVPQMFPENTPGGLPADIYTEVQQARNAADMLGQAPDYNVIASAQVPEASRATALAPAQIAYETQRAMQTEADNLRAAAKRASDRAAAGAAYSDALDSGTATHRHGANVQYDMHDGVYKTHDVATGDTNPSTRPEGMGNTVRYGTNPRESGLENLKHEAVAGAGHRDATKFVETASRLHSEADIAEFKAAGAAEVLRKIDPNARTYSEKKTENDRAVANMDIKRQTWENEAANARLKGNKVYDRVNGRDVEVKDPAKGYRPSYREVIEGNRIYGAKLADRRAVADKVYAEIDKLQQEGLTLSQAVMMVEWKLEKNYTPGPDGMTAAERLAAQLRKQGKQARADRVARIVDQDIPDDQIRSIDPAKAELFNITDEQAEAMAAGKIEKQFNALKRVAVTNKAYNFADLEAYLENGARRSPKHQVSVAERNELEQLKQMQVAEVEAYAENDARNAAAEAQRVAVANVRSMTPAERDSLRDPVAKIDEARDEWLSLRDRFRNQRAWGRNRVTAQNVQEAENEMLSKMHDFEDVRGVINKDRGMDRDQLLETQANDRRMLAQGMSKLIESMDRGIVGDTAAEQQHDERMKEIMRMVTDAERNSQLPDLRELIRAATAETTAQPSQSGRSRRLGSAAMSLLRRRRP